jgi:hypothetical protein
MRYEPVRRLLKKHLLSDLEADNPEVVAEALYSAARFEEDSQWVESLLLERLTSPHVRVRWAAATCFGDMASWGRPLDLKRVIPALESARQDPEISDPASFSLSMVEQFLIK